MKELEDFKIEVQRRYANSKINKTYKFPLFEQKTIILNQGKFYNFKYNLEGKIFVKEKDEKFKMKSITKEK